MSLHSFFYLPPAPVVRATFADVSLSDLPLSCPASLPVLLSPLLPGLYVRLAVLFFSLVVSVLLSPFFLVLSFFAWLSLSRYLLFFVRCFNSLPLLASAAAAQQH